MPDLPLPAPAIRAPLPRAPIEPLAAYKAETLALLSHERALMGAFLAALRADRTAGARAGTGAPA